MPVYSTVQRNLLAIGIVVSLILFVYTATGTLNIVMEKDPEQCEDTYFSIEDVCLETGKSAINNFQETVKMKITGTQSDINGFKINIFGQDGVEPAMLFRTIKKGDGTTISAPFKSSITGMITRIEVKPLLNINHQVHYCSLRHGIIYDKQIKEC